MENKVLLLNNLSFFPTYPPFSTSYLTALLKKENMEVSHVDVNLVIWKVLLSKEYLSKCVYRPECLVNSKFPICTQYISPTMHSIIKQNVLSNIESALEIFKSKEFYNVESLSWATNIVFQAQQLIYYHYGTFITYKVIFWPEIGMEVDSISKMHDLSCDKDHNPFIEIIEDHILPIIENESPTIIGLDVIWPWELVFASTLNKMIKANFHSIHINYCGFGFDEISFARIANRLSTTDSLFFDYDSIFLVKNTDALIRLYKSNLEIEEIASIPSLAVKTNHGSNIVNGPYVEQKYCLELIPDYSDLELNDYFTPELIFFDFLSTGCYWNQCTFCNINKHKNGRKEIDLNTFSNRIKTYKEKYNCKGIFFVDEAVSSKQLDRMCNILIEDKLDIKWTIRTRIEKEFNMDYLTKLHKAGCRDMWLGLETVSTQLVKDMRKNDFPENYKEIASHLLENASKIKMGLHFFLILGYPTEEKSHIKELVSFFKHNSKYTKDVPFWATFNIFSLNIDSYMYEHPEEFNISEIIINEDRLGIINTPFKTNNGYDIFNPKYKEELETVANELTSIIIPNTKLQLLWFSAGSGPWEMLLKSNLKSNPFMKQPSFFEKIIINNYSILEKNTLFMRIWNTISNKKYSKSKAVLYR